VRFLPFGTFNSRVGGRDLMPRDFLAVLAALLACGCVPPPSIPPPYIGQLDPMCETGSVQDCETLAQADAVNVGQRLALPQGAPLPNGAYPRQTANVYVRPYPVWGAYRAPPVAAPLPIGRPEHIL
jgi:hypothetical protein